MKVIKIFMALLITKWIYICIIKGNPFFFYQKTYIQDYMVDHLGEEAILANIYDTVLERG